MLNVNDHSRNAVGLNYVYPVVSRRAGGVSLGINLNVNNACNWRCVYCQVPDLARGGPPAVDVGLLEMELRKLLADIVIGDFLARNAPPEARRLVDLAFSGNGEPTSSTEFRGAVECVGRVMREFGLPENVVLRLITNGSLMHRPTVREGVAHIGSLGGEVWFKLDAATEHGLERINGVRMPLGRVRDSLLLCAELAPTWIQTCYFAVDGEELPLADQSAYLEFLTSVGKKAKGVLLYGLARPSRQPEAGRLSNVAHDRFHQFAGRIASLGLNVVASP
ncbi:MAG: radical SAM protein [Propionivibrio sp.]